jgi:orotate phosphoribosyltransferase
MNTYQKEFIEFLIDANVLKFGSFIAKSGRHLPYFINAGEIKTGAQINKLGEFYAKCYAEKLGDAKTVLYGPAYKGIPLAVSAASALSRNGLDLPFFFNRKEEKDHGEGGVFVGYKPKAGEEVVIIEDVITAGTAIRESIANMATLEGVNIKAVIIMVNRMEKGLGEVSAMKEIEQNHGFPVYSIVTVYDIIEYLETTPGIATPENIENIKKYLAEYGATA